MSEAIQESDDEGSQNEYIPRVGGEIDLDISVDSESPFVVIPRGGAKEIGRSCY
jgi:metallo-beta-lactamase family protein